MLAFIVGRLLWVVILAWVISVITFALFFALPPNQPGSNRQGLVAPTLQVQYNLHNKSLPAQYAQFVSRLVGHGDLGRSIRQPISVRAMIADTRASLRRAPETRKRFLTQIVPRAAVPLDRWITSIRPKLTREDARNEVPNSHPRSR